ncbi:MAG TPA: 50S ribosomal protein L17 [Candidatus Acidoferrales bacterium]|nr:50S ribosomal protein L17 [Candidatus Acidoferrales bacterium]
MRHLKAGKKLNRSGAHRAALMRNLVTALLKNERIQTTDAKAKLLRAWADQVISLGKEGTLNARRRAARIIRERAVVRKLFETIAPRFQGRAGGYTRTVKVGWRRGDHAPLCVVELIGRAGEAETTPKSARRASPKADEKASPASS